MTIRASQLAVDPAVEADDAARPGIGDEPDLAALPRLEAGGGAGRNVEPETARLLAVKGECRVGAVEMIVRADLDRSVAGIGDGQVTVRRPELISMSPDAPNNSPGVISLLDGEFAAKYPDFGPCQSEPSAKNGRDSAKPGGKFPRRQCRELNRPNREAISLLAAEAANSVKPQVRFIAVAACLGRLLADLITLSYRAVFASKDLPRCLTACAASRGRQVSWR
jgi:hypothetical protein